MHYFIKDLNRFAGRNVQIFGGGDSAVDWSLMLEPIAKKVTLIHRRDKFRAHEASVEKVMNSSVEVKTPFIPIKFIGEDQIEQVVLGKVKGDQEEVIDVDDVIVNYGFVSSLGSISEWGLRIVKNSIVVNSKMETSIEGIYAAGDICTYEGKVKLIAKVGLARLRQQSVMRRYMSIRQRKCKRFTVRHLWNKQRIRKRKLNMKTVDYLHSLQSIK